MGKRDIELTLRWTSLAFSFIFFLCFLCHSYLRLIYPYDITSADGFVLGFSLDFLQGKPIYTDVRTSLKPNVYPPLYYLLCAPLLHLTGPSFLPGKLISFLSSLGTGLLLYFMLKERVRDPSLALTLTFSFFSFYYTFFWSTLPRPDMLGLFLSILGIYLFRRRRRWLASLALVFSLLAKQNYVSAPVSIFLYFLLNKKYRQFFLQLLSMSIVFLSLFLPCLLYFGPEFLENTFLYAGSYQHSFRHYLFYGYIFAILPLLLLFSDAVFSPRDIFSLYGVTSFLVMLWLLFNPGSASNYFLEPTYALILAATNSPILKKRNSLIYVLLLIQLILSPGGGVLDWPWNNIKYLNSFYENLKVDEGIMEMVDAFNGSIMSECSGFLLFAGLDSSPDIWKLYTLKEELNLGSSIEKYCLSFDRVISFWDLPLLPECLKGFSLRAKMQRRNFPSVRYGEDEYFFVEIYEKG
ncbi:hypothetical protein DRN62_01075 [Nanoarchaeota archaeon]|nr:MAG: hypothetical protein DRN62_01075 [Nanoarchaeota archaeon]